MRRLTVEEQREYMRLQKKGYEILDRIKAEELRDKPYDFEEVDAVLSLADHYDGPPRLMSGLIEQQKRFMKRPDHPCNKDK